MIILTWFSDYPRKLKNKIQFKYKNTDLFDWLINEELYEYLNDDYVCHRLRSRILYGTIKIAFAKFVFCLNYQIVFYMFLLKNMFYAKVWKLLSSNVSFYTYTHIFFFISTYFTHLNFANCIIYVHLFLQFITLHKFCILKSNLKVIWY